MTAIVLRGDARQLPLPDGCVDLIVTSPPFYALRSYTDGGQHYENQIGSEATWQEYIANLLDCTREWARVLKPEGNLFVELGDKYSGAGSKVVTTYRGADMKTYQMAECASGCAYHSTVGGVCQFCGGPLTAPVTMTRDQARDALLHESDGRYAAGKAAVLAWMQSRA